MQRTLRIPPMRRLGFVFVFLSLTAAAVTVDQILATGVGLEIALRRRWTGRC